MRRDSMGSSIMGTSPDFHHRGHREHREEMSSCFSLASAYRVAFGHSLHRGGRENAEGYLLVLRGLCDLSGEPFYPSDWAFS